MRTANDTRRRLVAVMDRMVARSAFPRDFTAKSVAAAAGVSRQTLYEVAGTDFKERRSRLLGGAGSPAQIILTMRRRITDLEAALATAQADAAAARAELSEHGTCIPNAEVGRLLAVNEELSVQYRSARELVRAQEVEISRFRGRLTPSPTRPALAVLTSDTSLRSRHREAGPTA